MLLSFYSRIINATLFKQLSDSQSFSRSLVNEMANQFTRSRLRMEVAWRSPDWSERARLGVVAGLSAAPARHRLFPMHLDGRPDSLDLPSPSPRRTSCGCSSLRVPVFLSCFHGPLLIPSFFFVLSLGMLCHFKPFGILDLSLMTLDITTTLSFQQEAIASIMEKNKTDKKPHEVLRSCQAGFVVGCSEDECIFRMNVIR